MKYLIPLIALLALSILSCGEKQCEVKIVNNTDGVAEVIVGSKSCTVRPNSDHTLGLFNFGSYDWKATITIDEEEYEAAGTKELDKASYKLIFFMVNEEELAAYWQ